MEILKSIKGHIRNIWIQSMTQSEYQKYLRNKGVKIGEGCWIDKTAMFGSEPWLITIGNNVRITKNVQFITHDGGLWTLRNMGLIEKKAVKYGRIIIKDNCNVSWNTVIMPNVTIEENCVVAVGAVVTKDTEPNSVLGGVPAKRIESVFEYKDKIINYCVPTFFMTNEEKRCYLKEERPDLFDEEEKL